MPRATPETAANARRILVDGVSGSGKSTAARRIATRLGLVFADRDELLWLPGWVLVDEAAQRESVARLVATDSWIFDGTHGPWRALVLERAVKTWRQAFASRDSILWWQATSFASKRSAIRRQAAAESGVPVLVFRHPRDLDAWVESLPVGAGVAS